MNTDTPLMIDPDRHPMYADMTQIYVRASLNGEFGSYDIAELDTASLKNWLRSRGGSNDWAEACLAMVIGHNLDNIHETWPQKD